MNKLKSSKKLFVFLTVLVMLFAVNITVFAQNTWINDSAGLFSESDIASLQEELGMAKLYLDADVMAVTSKDIHYRKLLKFSVMNILTATAMV